MRRIIAAFLRTLLGRPGGATRLETVAGWCLWITCWGPILTILNSFQRTPYSYYIGYRQIVFPALLVQICLRLAERVELNLWKTSLLVALAILHNPIWMIQIGVAWPWRFIDAATVVVSFMAVAEVHDARMVRERASTLAPAASS
jgi:hypothetical protein